VILFIQLTWIPVSQPLAWTSCWRWATTSRFTIFLIMLSTTWGTTKMDRALSIPWAYLDCVQTWLSLTPTRRMSRGRILTSFKVCAILVVLNYLYVIVVMPLFIKLSNFIVKVRWTEPPPVPGFHHRGPWASEGPRWKVGEAPESWLWRLSIVCTNGAC